jgi:exonuclease VII small subunit
MADEGMRRITEALERAANALGRIADTYERSVAMQAEEMEILRQANDDVKAAAENTGKSRNFFGKTVDEE